MNSSFQRSLTLNTLCSTLTLAALLMSGAAAQSEGEAPARLLLGSDAWPPFTDVLGNPRVAIELVDEALERAGHDASFSIRDDFGRLMLQIRGGNLDGSPALWLDPDRQEFLHFSLPYMENRLVLVGRADSDVSARSLSDLVGKRVGIVGSYAYGEDIEGESRPEFVKGMSDKENLSKLLDGEVDYVLADDLLVRHLAERYADKVEETLEIGTTPLLTRSLHFALRKALPGAEAIINSFNREIQKMVADGSYNRILQLNWIHADVDGDGKFELVLGPGEAGKEAPKIGYALFAASMPDPGTSAETRYYIDGQVYEGWQSVPARYKIPMDPTPKYMKRGLTVLEWDF